LKNKGADKKTVCGNLTIINAPKTKITGKLTLGLKLKILKL